MVAQTLEYASWVDSLTLDQLDEMAREYAAKRGVDANGIADLYRRTFSAELEDTEDQGRQLAERITFNNRQRLVILAERISEEVEQTLRYLRTRFGADVYGVQFSVHQAGGDTIISTTTVVGREQVAKPAQAGVARERESDEAILARAKTEFVREAVSSIEKWVSQSGIEGLTVDHSTGSDHFIRYLGISWAYYYYAMRWLYMYLYRPSEEEVETPRAKLSKPESVQTGEGWDGWRFHIATNDDLEAVKDLIVQRVKARQAGRGAP